LYVWKQLSPSIEHSFPDGQVFGMTDTGNVRPSNEDNFLIDAHLGLIAVADGMGGHEAGEIASSEALTSMAHFLRASVTSNGLAIRPRSQPRLSDIASNDPEVGWSDSTMAAMMTIHDAVEFANQSMYQTNLTNHRRAGGGMGTTLTGMWQPQPGGPAFIFHVGDSRVYRLREGQLEQLTRDQTMHQHAIDNGATKNLPPRNLLMQALGPSPSVRPELQTHVVVPGDLFMLCSDGLHGTLEHRHIAKVLIRAASSDLGATCAQLIEMAKQDGSRDNITVVLFQCKQQA